MVEEEGESRGRGRLAGPVAPDDEEEIRAGAGRTRGAEAMRYGLYEDGRLAGFGERPRPVLVPVRGDPDSPEEARRDDGQAIGRGGQLLLGLALLTSSLISLSVLVLLVRLIAIL